MNRIHFSWLAFLASSMLLNPLFASSESFEHASSSTSSATSAIPRDINAMEFLKTKKNIQLVAEKTKKCGVPYWELIKTATDSTLPDGESGVRHLGLLINNLESIHADEELLQQLKAGELKTLPVRKITTLSLYEPALKATLGANTGKTEIDITTDLLPLIENGLTHAIDINSSVNMSTYSKNKKIIDETLQLILMNKYDLENHLVTPLLTEQKALESSLQASQKYLDAINAQSKEAGNRIAKGTEKEKDVATRQFQAFIPIIRNLNVKIGTEKTTLASKEKKIAMVKALLGRLSQNQSCVIQ